MIKLEHTVTASPEQMEFIIEGMRNPMNSWEKSDSAQYIMSGEGFEDIHGFKLGDNDYDLMTRLRNAGTDHRKFMRMMPVYVRITAPLYWWKEFDTYKVGTVSNSCSTMHKIHAKEFTLDDFSHEHLISDWGNDKLRKNIIMPCTPMQHLQETIACLNVCRKRYLSALKTEDECGISAKHIWWQMIQLLPSSYNQTRNIMMNYEVLANIYHSRKGHKLDEWKEFCKWIETLPYLELITGTSMKDIPICNEIMAEAEKRVKENLNG